MALAVVEDLDELEQAEAGLVAGREVDAEQPPRRERRYVHADARVASQCATKAGLE